jgi:hypothetical protein
MLKKPNACHHLAALIHWDEQSEFGGGPGAWHCWTKPLRGRFKSSVARDLQDGQQALI